MAFINFIDRVWTSMSTWKSSLRLIALALIGVLAAAVLFYILDKFFLYFLAKSYVDDVAEIFDLNQHLAQAIALGVFAIVAVFSSMTISRKRVWRRVGQFALVALLIGHSLALWQGSKDQFFARSGQAIKWYVVTKDRVVYCEHAGTDPGTGKPCRMVTPEVVEKLQAYSRGERAQRITAEASTFFDPRTGEPVVWYYRDSANSIELFNLMGYHPEMGGELQPVTPGIVADWKVQIAEQKRAAADKERRAPRLVDPATYPFFNSVTGAPQVWFWKGSEGKYEFYDAKGFQPKTGEALNIITPAAIATWRQEIDAAEKRAQELMRQREQLQRDRVEQQERQRVAVLEAQKKIDSDNAARIEKEQRAGSDCDTLAANPTDARKGSNVIGVPYSEVKAHSREAQEVCTQAMKNSPTELRYFYQYTRALQPTDPAKAFENFRALTQKRYAAAFDNAGWLAIQLNKGYPVAVEYFKQGAGLNDGDCLVSLADMIDRGQFGYVPNTPEAQAAKYTLIARAAELGHAGAQLAVVSERAKMQQQQQALATQAQQQAIMMQMFGAVLGGMRR